MDLTRGEERKISPDWQRYGRGTHPGRITEDCTEQIDSGPAICACFNVGRNNITSCLKNGQASTVEDIGELLQAGTNCGSCIPELKELIKDNVISVPASESA